MNTLVQDLVIKYWSVFADKDLFVSVKDYECTIDTDTARPISVSKINYGPCESTIMEKCIAALSKLDQIEQIHRGPWMSKALLAPMPHQEHIVDILDFVWQFCVNYISLNAVTIVSAYPIPRFNNAVRIAFGNGL